jgi:hypothetical protein
LALPLLLGRVHAAQIRRTSVPAAAVATRGRGPEWRIRAVPRHGVAMMGVDLDGTILLLALAAEPANLRLVRHRSGRRGGEVDGTSRKVEMASTAPSTALE